MPVAELEQRPPLEVLAADMERFIHDPLAWVHYAFPWGDPDTELKDYAGPDTWQTEVLEDITAKLQKKETTPGESVGAVIREAISAGNGPGKSAFVAWIILWAMSTFEDTRGVVTANTDTQLRTKTWAELAKWHRLCICKPWFNLTATAIHAKDKEHERTWRIDQVPWSEEKTEAFAGLHNKGKRVILIFDEASAIPDKIWEVAEGALTDKDTEIIWLVSGNPTRNTGRFRECWSRFAHRWKKWQIDIRNSILVNQDEVRKWIEDLGIDSDWVRVHVLGLFPHASSLQFIPTDIAEAAKGRKIPAHQFFYDSKIIGVDPAWTGGDEITIYIRQGYMSWKLQTFQKNDDDSTIAKAIARWEDQEHADAVFIDQGYGTGIYSFGKTMNRSWTLVNFGAKSSKMGFANKRAEMWDDMKRWLVEGGCIPDDPRMVNQLISVEAWPHGRQNVIILESKESMRKRGLESPGRADALALTFAMPVKKKLEHQYPQAVSKDFNPFVKQQSTKKEYNPFAKKTGG